MKRDMTLIRKLLEYFEEHADGSTGPTSRLPEIEGYSAEQVHGHAWLCLKAKLVEGRVPLKPAIGSCVTALTWEGHDKLHQLRTPKRLGSRVRVSRT